MISIKSDEDILPPPKYIANVKIYKPTAKMTSSKSNRIRHTIGKPGSCEKKWETIEGGSKSIEKRSKNWEGIENDDNLGQLINNDI